MNIERLYEERRKKGYSQEELANLCNVSRQAVSKWESGQSLPDSDKLVALSRALGVSIDYLLDNEDMSEQKVKVRIDYDDLVAQERKHEEYEYKSKTTIFGLPLVHIHRTTGYAYGYYGARRRFKPKVAKGIIAIGDVAIGLLSIGLISIGVFSFGLLGLAILGLGILQLGFYSFGIIAVGFCAVGVIALGTYATGTIAIASNTAIGVVAIGKHAVGVETYGKLYELAIDSKVNHFCNLDAETMNATFAKFDQHWMPFPLRIIFGMITKC